MAKRIHREIEEGSFAIDISATEEDSEVEGTGDAVATQVTITPLKAKKVVRSVPQSTSSFESVNAKRFKIDSSIANVTSRLEQAGKEEAMLKTIDDFKADLRALRTEMGNEMRDIRGEYRNSIQQLQAEVRNSIQGMQNMLMMAVMNRNVPIEK